MIFLYVHMRMSRGQTHHKINITQSHVPCGKYDRKEMQLEPQALKRAQLSIVSAYIA
jgi:hypothetical protein